MTLCACIQMTATPDAAANREAAAALVDQAGREGAAFIALPEAADLLAPDSAAFQAHVDAGEPARFLEAMAGLARRHRATILVGSIAARAGDGRLANRSYLLDSEGRTVARYDKIHLFDTGMVGARTYRESDTYAPGAEAVLCQSPLGPLGLSICYDLRFPALFRALAKAGARALAIPAAFTEETGAAHWHVLMRARAIENGAFVIAPAQCGQHHEGRRTYGHSLIVDPWGRILAEGGTEPGIVMAELDSGAVDWARAAIGSLSHDRPFSLTVV
ncbi:MAG TPA: carbon-nitrogen hydrolase family protein [Azospirillaceae bacterium]|nr:carbon-nitrogen hydrolase family protein [Azospirillaceae bacterium]